MGGTGGAADGDASTMEENSVFTVNTIQFDRISAHILGLILPETRHLKVLRFVDCRLNLEMIRLLRLGLTGQCSVECLQVDFNPPPEGSDAGPSWVLRKYSELKAMSLMENAIKSEDEMAKLQRGLLRPRAEGDPRKPVELVLVDTPLAAALLQKNPDLKPQDKKAFVFPPAGP